MEKWIFFKGFKMKCPRTNTDLTPVKVGGITVDISEACGGVFFDNHELEHFDEKHERRGQVLVEHLNQFVPPQLNLSERISCPKCTDVVMARHFYSPEHLVEIDECPGCGGIWFDYAELEKLRELFPNQSDRQRAGERFASLMESSSRYITHQRELESKEELASRLRRRGLCFIDFFLE